MHSVYGMRGCFSKNFTNEWRVAHGKSHSIGTQRHPTTENPREGPQVNTRTTGKGSGHPPKKLSPLDEWKAGREKAIGNPDWYIYDNTIRKLVSEINRHLSTSKNIEKYKPLDWKLIKAMIWTETGATVAAWKTRPIQIGNTGDEGSKKWLFLLALESTTS